jgi:SAM-dependent methyltransferase
METSTAYHETELARLLASEDRRRLLPCLPARFTTILDIGCGIGQTLVACDFGPDVEAYGVDVDREALSSGRGLASGVRFVQAVGEQLPFADGAFDVVVSRVALPYMHVPAALDEIGRVLKSGGYCWLTLHSLSTVRNRLARSIKAGRIKDVIFSTYILANGLLFHWTGRQIRFPLNRRRCESFQTVLGMRRALRMRGLDVVSAVSEPSCMMMTFVKRP